MIIRDETLTARYMLAFTAIPGEPGWSLKDAKSRSARQHWINTVHINSLQARFALKVFQVDLLQSLEMLCKSLGSQFLDTLSVCPTLL